MTVRQDRWDFQSFVEEFKIFGNFILAYAAIVGKYCSPDGRTTPELRAEGAREIYATMERYTTEELLAVYHALGAFHDEIIPPLMDLIEKRLDIIIGEPWK